MKPDAVDHHAGGERVVFRCDGIGELFASAAGAEVIASEEAVQLGLLAFSDILVFFGVLLVGFAYVWKRGDLEWVRAVINTSSQRAAHDP